MFTTPLDIRQIGDQEFQLLSPLVYENEWCVITLSVGLSSDGASIPRAFWTHAGCPIGGVYTRSAFLHDALYRSHIFDKETCDSLFLEAMESDGVPLLTREMLHGAVVTFGGLSYNAQKDIPAYRDMVKIDVKGV